MGGTQQSAEELAEDLDVPKLAAGGIVSRPTLALIGEAGPEAVIPLRGGNNGQQSQETAEVRKQNELLAAQLKAAEETQRILIEMMRQGQQLTDKQIRADADSRERAARRQAKEEIAYR